MARYFHVTTAAGTTTTKVPEGWMPTIQGGLLSLPDGTEVEASAITASHFESKRETPARDRLVALVTEAKAEFDSEFTDMQQVLGNPESGAGLRVSSFVSAVAAYQSWRNADVALAKHDENVKASAEAAKQRKLNPTPKPEAKPKPAPKKKK